VGYIDKNYRRKRVHEKEPVVRSHRRLNLGLKVDTHSLTTKTLWNVARTSPHRMFDETPAQSASDFLVRILVLINLFRLIDTKLYGLSARINCTSIFRVYLIASSIARVKARKRRHGKSWPLFMHSFSEFESMSMIFSAEQ